MIVTQGEHQYSLVAHSEWLHHNTYFIIIRSPVDIFSAIWPVTKLAMALHWESLRQNSHHKSIHGCLASSYHPSNPSTNQPIPRTFRRTHSPNSRNFPRRLLFLWLPKDDIHPKTVNYWFSHFFANRLGPDYLPGPCLDKLLGTWTLNGMKPYLILRFTSWKCANYVFRVKTGQPETVTLCGGAQGTTSVTARHFQSHGLQLRSHFVSQLGHCLKKISDQSVVGNLKDGSICIFIDGNNSLGILHSGQVLDGTTDANCNVELGCHNLAAAHSARSQHPPRHGMHPMQLSACHTAAQGPSQSYPRSWDLALQPPHG